MLRASPRRFGSGAAWASRLWWHAGQPRDGNPAACYLMHDTGAGTVTSWRVPYDHEAACARLHEEGLPQELALRLTDGR